MTQQAIINMLETTEKQKIYYTEEPRSNCRSEKYVSKDQWIAKQSKESMKRKMKRNHSI
jgi:hypothetical protein